MQDMPNIFIVKYDGISAIKQYLNSQKYEQPTKTKPITS